MEQKKLLKDWFWRNLANIFTILRTILFFMCLPLAACGIAISNFMVATIGITGVIFSLVGDILDGIIARSKFSETTKFGKIVDPLMDKTIWLVYFVAFFFLAKNSQDFLWLLGLAIMVLVLVVADVKSSIDYLSKYLINYNSLEGNDKGSNSLGKIKFWLVSIAGMSQLIYLVKPVESGNFWVTTWMVIIGLNQYVFSYLLWLLFAAIFCSVASLYIKMKNR